MKITYFFAIFSILLISCTNSNIQPNAKATQRVLLEYNCESPAKIPMVYGFLKEKINHYAGDIVVKRVAQLMLNPNQFEIEIASVADMDSFLNYLLSSSKVEFWMVHRPEDLPDFQRLLNDSLSTMIQRVKYDKSILLVNQTDTAQVNQMLSKNKFTLPKHADWRWGNYQSENKEQLRLFLIKKYANPENHLNSMHFKKAEAGQNPQTGQSEVNIEFNQQGAMTWGRMTTEAAAKDNDIIVITADKVVVSAPRVRTPIIGGRCTISSNFAEGEAEILANHLKFGVLNFCNGKVVSIEAIN